VASDVKIYQSEDIDPAYKVYEDHFPKPQVKGGERRYDLVRPALPRFSGANAAGGGQSNSAQTQNFRKMAIYVKNGRIEKVFEEIDVVGHKDFVEAKKNHQQHLLDLEERILKGQTQNKIRQRKASIVFDKLGTSIKVRKPEGLIAALKEIYGTNEAAGAFKLTGTTSGLPQPAESSPSPEASGDQSTNDAQPSP
jgi:hypothetical protein